MLDCQIYTYKQKYMQKFQRLPIRDAKQHMKGRKIAYKIALILASPLTSHFGH